MHGLMNVQAAFLDDRGRIWALASQKQRADVVRETGYTRASVERTESLAAMCWADLPAGLRAMLEAGHMIRKCDNDPDGLALPFISTSEGTSSGTINLHIGTGAGDSILHVELPTGLAGAMCARWLFDRERRNDALVAAITA